MEKNNLKVLSGTASNTQHGHWESCLSHPGTMENLIIHRILYRMLRNTGTKHSVVLALGIGWDTGLVHLTGLYSKTQQNKQFPNNLSES